MEIMSTFPVTFCCALHGFVDYYIEQIYGTFL